jgi:8-oxo-dGTP pyrophosphatase MutT (NUDIX family)
MIKKCDNTSVGVIIRNSEGQFALLRRAHFPVGIAPVAGHIDSHGSPEQAALDEAEEELGVSPLTIKKTAIYDRRVENKCRRPNGSYHVWYVYDANTAGTLLKPSADETKGAAWYDVGQLEALAARTRSFQAGKISEEDWATNPGLEEVWLAFMEELGYISPERQNKEKI